MSKSKNWCFRISNPTVLDSPLAWAGVKYLVYQKEFGEQGTPHLQGYVIFNSEQRLAALKKLNSGAHWEPRRGSHEDASHYCKKPVQGCECRHCVTARTQQLPEEQHESGTPPAPGKRNDLLAVKEKIYAGATYKTILNENFVACASHSAFFREVIRIQQPRRNFKTEVIIVTGPPGSGKSYWCREQCKLLNSTEEPYMKPQGKWWDDYSNEENVIMDEFSGSHCPWATLLNLLDEYPMLVEVKNGYAQFNSKRIFITANTEYHEWYEEPKIVANMGALERRITHLGYKPRRVNGVYQPIQWKKGGFGVTTPTTPLVVPDEESPTRDIVCDSGANRITFTKNVRGHDVPIVVPRYRFVKDAEGNFKKVLVENDDNLLE